MVTGYSKIQIALHWATALFVLFNLIFSDAMTAAWRAFRKTGEASADAGAWAHIIVGVLVLLFALWRMSLRLTRGVPDAPAGESALVKLAGDLGHWALYALMLALPVTGLLAWFGGIATLAELHAEILKSLLWVTIVLHVAAAIWHHFILKDGLLDRMRKAQD